MPALVTPVNAELSPSSKSIWLTHDCSILMLETTNAHFRIEKEKEREVRKKGFEHLDKTARPKERVTTETSLKGRTK